MVVCVECGAVVNSLYSTYGKDNIVLDKCNVCGEIADKYVEFDSVVQVVDLILHKTPVYRHLLLNVPVSLNRRQKGIFLFLNALIDLYISFNKDLSTVPNRLLISMVVRSITGALLYYLIIWCVVRSQHTQTAQIQNSLILSSFPRLLHVLFFVWDYGRDGTLDALVTLATLSSHFVALRAVCRKSLFLPFLAVLLGYTFRHLLNI